MLPTQIFLSFATFSWFDLIALFVLIFYSIEGMEEGFVDSFLHAGSLLISFIVGLLLYGLIGKVFFDFGIFSYGFACAIAFFLVAVFSQGCFLVGFSYAANYWFTKKVGKISFLPLNIFGVIPGFFSGYILLAFFLTFALTLPISPVIKNIVSSSVFGTTLVLQTQDAERLLWSFIKAGSQDNLTFFSVDLGSTAAKEVGFKVKKPVLDEASKKHILGLVNAFRIKEGMLPVVLDNTASTIAQDHAVDMANQGYLSFYTRSGLSVIDRLASKDVIFTHAEELFALAPNATLAVNGFLSQQNTKAILLSKQARIIGIGVADAGTFGKMFVLDFID